MGASCLLLYKGSDDYDGNGDGNNDDYNSDVSEDDDDYSSPTLPGASCLLLYEGGGGCGGDDDYDVDDYSHSDSAWCFLPLLYEGGQQRLRPLQI